MDRIQRFVDRFLILTYTGISIVVSPHLAPGEDVIEPMALFSVILPAYFGGANLCYIFVWLSELVLHRFFGGDRSRLRLQLCWGFVLLSAAVTSLPFWYVCYAWWIKA